MSQYAAILKANAGNLQEPYSVSWEFSRYDENQNTDEYVGLEEVEFSEAQLTEIQNLNGIVFTDAESFNSWNTANGEYIPEEEPDGRPVR